MFYISKPKPCNVYRALKMKIPIHPLHIQHPPQPPTPIHCLCSFIQTYTDCIHRTSFKCYNAHLKSYEASLQIATSVCLFIFCQWSVPPLFCIHVCSLRFRLPRRWNTLMKRKKKKKLSVAYICLLISSAYLITMYMAHLVGWKPRFVFVPMVLRLPIRCQSKLLAYVTFP